jgi:hypothetical protein
MQTHLIALTGHSRAPEGPTPPSTALYRERPTFECVNCVLYDLHESGMGMFTIHRMESSSGMFSFP